MILWGSELKPYIFFLFLILAKSSANHCSLAPRMYSGEAIKEYTLSRPSSVYVFSLSLSFNLRVVRAPQTEMEKELKIQHTIKKARGRARERKVEISI